MSKDIAISILRLCLIIVIHSVANVIFLNEKQILVIALAPVWGFIYSAYFLSSITKISKKHKDEIFESKESEA